MPLALSYNAWGGIDHCPGARCHCALLALDSNQKGQKHIRLVGKVIFNLLNFGWFQTQRSAQRPSRAGGTRGTHRVRHRCNRLLAARAP